MSNIISDTIDGEFPVAGIDNDTQGFRDNFSIIKTALATANSEITTLETSTAKLNEENDFKGKSLINPLIAISSKKYLNTGSHESGSNISFLNGHYQTVSISLDNQSPGTITFTLADWPERDGMSKMTVEFKGTASDQEADVTHTVMITGEGGATFKKSSNYPSEITVKSVSNRDNPVIVEFWTVNSGKTIYANYLGVFGND